MPRSKLLSKISSYNFHVSFDKGADSFGTYFLPDQFNKEKTITDLDIVDIQTQWSYAAIIAKTEFGTYSTRAYFKYPIQELKVYDLYKSGGEIITSAGLEMVQFDNQVLIYHIESKDNQNYLVVNELLFVYAP